ncbi:TolB-like 6-bladed beta-propeller domain-containing protein [Parabacteroides pacaensis]|uniref:BF3164 family lipoprotein n=1 Tax=Parabacteroides pacaensis TaxID=2086575 RepID=UPI000D0F8240|nr:BF3164 family lipoprotein [Parabacteroides pacaensis]
MMYKNYCILIGLVIFLLGSGCNENSSPSANYMTLDSVQYVEKFPKSITLFDKLPIKEEIIGLSNFIICDSLLIAYVRDNEGFWSFYSLNDFKCLGQFLSVGNGPNEFTQPTSVINATFFKEGGQLYAGIYDFYKGKVYKMNIGESLKNKQLSISLINDSIPPTLFNFALIDSTTFFCKKITNDQTQQIRYILKDGKEYTPDYLAKLNQASIHLNEDINILSTIDQLNNELNLMVEIPIGLNQINLYSLKDTWGKIICVGNKLDNIKEIQSISKWERKYTYAYLRVFKKFFAALYFNEEEKQYQIKRTKLPVIQLFDWKGNPLIELKLNSFITSFDIDFINGYLYTFDYQTDELYKYDIKGILTELE